MDLNVGYKESLRIVEEYVKSKEGDAFSKVSDDTIRDLMDMVDSANIKDSIELSKNSGKHRLNDLRVVDIYISEEGYSVNELQKKYGKDVVEFDRYKWFKVNFLDNLRALFLDIETENHIIRMFYNNIKESHKNNGESLFTIIKKSDDLSKVRVVQNRIPNCMLRNKSVYLIGSHNKVGLEFNVEELVRKV